MFCTEVDCVVRIYCHVIIFDCSCDNVDSFTIYSMIYDEPQSIGTYCGSKLPPRMMSATNRFEVEFTTHSRSQDLDPDVNWGFHATYKLVSGESHCSTQAQSMLFFVIFEKYREDRHLA